MPVVGLALTITGTVVALGGLFALRRDTCPRCGASGTLVTTHRVIDEAPGLGFTLRLARCCGDCGAVVEETHEAAAAGVTGLSRRLVRMLAR